MMKLLRSVLLSTVAVAVAIAGLSPLAVHGATPAGAAADEQAIRQVEDEITAALGRNDADALTKLWAPEYTFVNPAGALLTRDQRLALLRSGELKIEKYTRDDESIHVYGTTAVDTYRSTVGAQRNGQDISSSRRVITVLVKRDGRWQAVAQQSTVIIQK